MVIQSYSWRYVSESYQKNFLMTSWHLLTLAVRIFRWRRLRSLAVNSSHPHPSHPTHLTHTRPTPPTPYPPYPRIFCWQTEHSDYFLWIAPTHLSQASDTTGNLCVDIHSYSSHSLWLPAIHRFYIRKNLIISMTCYVGSDKMKRAESNLAFWIQNLHPGRHAGVCVDLGSHSQIWNEYDN